jgi:hypothetical protein
MEDGVLLLQYCYYVCYICSAPVSVVQPCLEFIDGALKCIAREGFCLLHSFACLHKATEHIPASGLYAAFDHACIPVHSTCIAAARRLAAAQQPRLPSIVQCYALAGELAYQQSCQGCLAAAAAVAAVTHCDFEGTLSILM